MVIDDYGHHPTEIRAVIEATKKGFPGMEISLAFQPHRYSRTRDCYSEFVDVLKIPEKLFLFDIYPAGETSILGISSHQLIEDIKRNNIFHLEKFEDASQIISENIADKSILIIMGAGSVGNFSKEFIGSA